MDNNYRTFFRLRSFYLNTSFKKTAVFLKHPRQKIRFFIKELALSKVDIFSGACKGFNK